MHRKIWKWCFIGFALIVIAVIAITLVLLDDAQIQQDEDNIGGKEEQVYATSMTLNLPNRIYIIRGQTVNLRSNYVKVLPSSMINKMSYSVVGANNGINFENDIITANEVGEYKIIFKVPNSETSFITKSLDIYVTISNNKAHIELIKSEFIITENIIISDLFNVKFSNYSVITDSKITCNSGVLTASQIGLSEILFCFTDNYIQYNYKFYLTVRDIPEFKIKLNNVSNNTIVLNLLDPTFQINFYILNRNETVVQKAIYVVSDNEDVVEIERVTAPLIKLKAVSIGSATITISLKDNLEISLTINVIVQ